MEIPTEDTGGQPTKQNRSVMEAITIPNRTIVILVDASWDNTRKAGWGTVVYNTRGELITVAYGAMIATDPLHAEAMALLETPRGVQTNMPTSEPNKVHVFSDCMVLVNSVNNNSVENLPSWSASETVAHCARLAHQMKESVTLRYGRREAIRVPHLLSNWARRTRRSFAGISTESGTGALHIESHINPQFFSIQS